MSDHWTERKERGTTGAIRLIVWIAGYLGRPIARAVLVPACLYFIVSGRAARVASREYLRRVFGRAPTWREIFRHYFVFSTITLDRVYLLAGRSDLFDVRIHGIEAFDEPYAQKHGLIMFGAHFGSFDILRCLAEGKGDLPINILMHEANAQMIREVLGAVAPHLRERVIALGQPETFLRVKELLDRGEVIGLLADRGLPGDRRVMVPFLGEPASWPLGPMVLASIVKAPVILFFSVYRGGNQYDIYMEPFAESVTADRKNREADLAAWVERYAQRVEAHAKSAPYNWFNFYDFWAKH
ncbi:MAG: acyl-CoA synthetase [Burkholderiales bacterium]